MSFKEPRFRRALIVVALIHVLLIGGLIWYFTRPIKKTSGQLTWMDTGSFSNPKDSTIEPTMENNPQTQPTPESIAKPHPTPPVEAIETPAEKRAEPPSEISLATPKPSATTTPTLIPEPSRTPKPTSKPTPKPSATPSPTPKPTPKPAPKPTHETEETPKPKPSPTTSPKHISAKSKNSSNPKPKPKEIHQDEKESPPHKSSSADKSDEGGKKISNDNKKSSLGNGDNNGSSDAKAAFLASKGGGTGTSGNGGNGADPGTIDAYHSLIHDRFYSQWEQPTSIPSEHRHDFSTMLKITIQRDGTISDFSLARPSGNPVMDESVLEAARKVLKIAPVPAGMGNSAGYTININFELE